MKRRNVAEDLCRTLAHTEPLAAAIASTAAAAAVPHSRIAPSAADWQLARRLQSPGWLLSAPSTGAGSPAASAPPADTLPMRHRAPPVSSPLFPLLPLLSLLRPLPFLGSCSAGLARAHGGAGGGGGYRAASGLLSLSRLEISRGRDFCVASSVGNVSWVGLRSGRSGDSNASAAASSLGSAPHTGATLANGRSTGNNSSSGGGGSSSCSAPEGRQAPGNKSSSGGGGGGGGAAGHASTGAARRDRAPGAGRGGGKPLQRIKDAASVQELEAVVQRHRSALSFEPQLLATALTRLVQLTASSGTPIGSGGGSASRSDRGTAAGAPSPPQAAAAQDASAGGDSPSSTASSAGGGAATASATSASAGSERKDGGCAPPPHLGGPRRDASAEGASAVPSKAAAAAATAAGAVSLLAALLPRVPAAVRRMRTGELGACAWSIGKLRPCWESSLACRTAAVQAADAVGHTLAADWLQHFTPQQQQQQQQEQQQPVSSSNSSSSDGDAAAFGSGTGSSSGIPAAADNTGHVDASAPPASPTPGAAAAGGGGVSAGGALWSQARSHDVSSLAWGLSRTWQQGDTATATGPEADGGGARACTSLSSLPAGTREAAWQWLAAAGGDVLWTGAAREVANLVGGFAAAGRSDPQLFDNLLAALAHPRRGPAVVSGLREEECTAVLWATAGAFGGDVGGTGGMHQATAKAPSMAASAMAGRGCGTGDDEEEAEAAEAAARRRALAPSLLGRALALLGPGAAELAMHGRVTGRQISSMMRSLVSLQEASGAELKADWLEALALRAGHKAKYMDGRALGDAAWALGKARLRHEGALRALCATALHSLQQQQQQQRHQQPRSTGEVDAAAVASVPPEPAAAAGRAAGAGAGPAALPSAHLSAPDLVRLLWACGRLQYADDQLIEAAQTHLPPEIPTLDPTSLSSLTFALAALRRHHHPTFTAICSRARQLLPPPPPPDAAALSQDEQQGTQPQEQQEQHQQQQWERHGEGTSSSAARLSASQLAALVAALGRVEHYDSELIDQACDRLGGPRSRGDGMVPRGPEPGDEGGRPPRLLLGELRPREVCAVVSALSQLEHPHAALLAVVDEHVAGDVLSYQPTELIGLLYGFGTTGTRAERLAAAAAPVLTRRVSRLDPEDVARLAESYAVQGLPHDDLFQAVAVVAIGRRQRFSPDQLERIAWAFRTLGYEGSEELTAEGGEQQRASEQAETHQGFRGSGGRGAARGRGDSRRARLQRQEP